MIGVVRDPVFGPAISFGLGGTMVEVIRDRAVALPPLNPFLARDLIRRTRASQALQPLRGAPAADEEAVEDILLRVSEIVCELPDVGAIDINPLIVTEKGAVVVDARIGVLPPPADGAALRPHGDPPVSERAARYRWNCRAACTATIRPIRPEDAAIEQRVRPRAVGAVEVPALHVRPAATSRRRCCRASRRSTTTASWR